MGGGIDTGQVRITLEPNWIRRAYFDGHEEPVTYGLRGRVKEFYKVEPKEERPTTLEHVESALAG